MLKLILLVFLFFFSLEVTGNASSHNKIQPIIDSHRLSEKIWVEIPELGKLNAERIFSQDLGQSNFSWTGRVLGVEKGFLTFSKVNGSIHGSVNSLGGTSFKFFGSADGLTFEKEKSASRCGGCVVHESLPPDPRRNAIPAMSWRNGEAHLIDLLIVYPAAVRSEAGNTADVEAAIASAVADSNLCYRKSLVPIQLRVVHTAEVSYTPTGTLNH